MGWLGHDRNWYWDWKMHSVQDTTSDWDSISQIEWSSIIGLSICLRLHRIGLCIGFRGKSELYRS